MNGLTCMSLADRQAQKPPLTSASDPAGLDLPPQYHVFYTGTVLNIKDWTQSVDRTCAHTKKGILRCLLGRNVHDGNGTAHPILREAGGKAAAP